MSGDRITRGVMCMSLNVALHVSHVGSFCQNPVSLILRATGDEGRRTENGKKERKTRAGLEVPG